jgi:16S rRNA (cytidine1402-2'-O)-methyltransferase
MNDANPNRAPGKLYVVATPIGNQEDITLRAVRILGQVNQIAAEDTRKTGRFLASFDIEPNLISYHEHNEEGRTPTIIKKLKAGFSIALVSNAGTPCVSDPGYRLITTAIANNIEVIPIPGVSAATAALSASGLPSDTFLFVGFAAKKRTKRQRQLEALADQPQTIIFYESPRRIIALLEDVIAAMGNRAGVLAREMTKAHEEFVRGSLSSILKCLKERPKIKGECTLLVAGSSGGVEVCHENALSELKRALNSEGVKISAAVREVARKYNLPKNRVYETALQIQNGKKKSK